AAKLLGVSFIPRLTQPNNLILEEICSDPDVVVDYEEDALNHGLITLRLARDIFVHGDFFESAAGASQFTLPYVMYFSPDDKLTAIEGARLFHQKSGSKDKTFKEFPGSKHELHNEPDVKDAVISDYIAWITTRSGESKL
ncbi:hypothetical protein HK101_001153, partial [Irineochytrium annulatum]